MLRLRVLVVSTAARSVKEVNTAAVERSWREAFAAASPAQVRKLKLAKSGGPCAAAVHIEMHSTSC